MEIATLMFSYFGAAQPRLYILLELLVSLRIECTWQDIIRGVVTS